MYGDSWRAKLSHLTDKETAHREREYHRLRGLAEIQMGMRLTHDIMSKGMQVKVDDAIAFIA